MTDDSTNGGADDLVLYRVEDGVAVITLNRPDKANSVVPELQDGYAAAMWAAEADQDVRAIVVTGAGSAFCAGADLGVLGGGVEGFGDVGDSIAKVMCACRLNTPVIAAINGGCAGMGLALAASADVRFAASTAKLTTSFAQRGLIAEYGLAWLLPRLIGTGRAMDLLLSGRMFSATEAAQYGFVQEVCEPEGLLPAAIGYARQLVTGSAPTSMAVIKAQVLRGWDGSFADDIARAMVLMPPSWAGPDLGEGIASYLERRAPKFEPLDHSRLPD